MSGHSKWSQIKRQKGVTDAKKGQAFTKVSRAIVIAVRQGGGVTDPSVNFKLRLIIEKARQINMPKLNIDRAIERGKGIGDKVEITEMVYEGFGPGGTAIIIEAATDNKLRTTAEVKNVFDKNSLILGNPGSVSYQFETKGFLSAAKNGKSSDEILLLAADAGAQDLEESDTEIFIYTKPDKLAIVKENLSKHLTILETEIVRKPTVLVQITDKEVIFKLFSFLDKLENLDDVQKVYANFDIPDTILLNE